MKTLKIFIPDLPSSRVSNTSNTYNTFNLDDNWGDNWNEYFQVPTDLEILEEDEYLSRNMAINLTKTQQYYGE